MDCRRGSPLRTPASDLWVNERRVPSGISPDSAGETLGVLLMRQLRPVMDRATEVGRARFLSPNPHGLQGNEGRGIGSSKPFSCRRACERGRKIDPLKRQECRLSYRAFTVVELFAAKLFVSDNILAERPSRIRMYGYEDDEEVSLLAARRCFSANSGRV